MARLVVAALLALAMACQALAWPSPFGAFTGSRAAPGAGTFPRWQALGLATEHPIRWLVALPDRRLAAVDADGALLVAEIGSGAVRVLARYGGVASPDGPPVAVRLDQDQTGVVLAAPDGRLLVWGDGTLRGYDVGGPLSAQTCPTPVAVEGRASHDLLAVTRDGAVVLIAGLAAGGPRAVARVDAHALPDARITWADLDGTSEAVVLSGAVDRLPGTAPGRADAAAVSVVRIRPHGLELRARFAARAGAAFEDVVPVLAPIGGSARPVALVTRSTLLQGAVPVALALGDAGLVLRAEGQGAGPGPRRLAVIGTADLSGDGVPEVVAVANVARDGVLTAYRRAGSVLAAVASAAGYAAPSAGPRPEQAAIADLDGDGRPEVALLRHSREILAALELRQDRFVERWAIDFKSPVTSNLAVADLDGDGLLDLALATRRGLHVFLSTR